MGDGDRNRKEWKRPDRDDDRDDYIERRHDIGDSPAFEENTLPDRDGPPGR